MKPTDLIPPVAIFLAAVVYAVNRNWESGLVFALTLGIYLGLDRFIAIRRENDQYHAILERQMETFRILEKRVDENHKFALEQIKVIQASAVANAVRGR